MSLQVALSRLLNGTDLTVEQSAPGVLVLRHAVTPIALKPTAAHAPTAPKTQSDRAPPIASLEENQVAEIVVGSHIRGVKDGASPVITLGREEIDRGGYATVADALAALPQTFNGTTSDDVALAGSDPTYTNSHFSTAVNLRGLGADATLVLINGRRIAGAGLMGDFADISMIPLATVSRVEVLTDGASALYGSDAVGGVINVVMRDRFEGLETRARIGGSTHGDLAQRQFAQTWGHSWSSGSFVLNGEFQRRDHVAAARRKLTASTDLRPFGGIDHRVYFSQPGTVLVPDPVTGSLAPTYAIPSGQDGTALKASDFILGKNLANLRGSIDLLPTQERTSLYFSINQDVGHHVTLNAEARYSDRRYAAFGYAPLAVMLVTKANPYFVSPNAAASNFIAYSFANETGASKTTGQVQSSSLSLGAKVDLPAQWRLDAYVVHAEQLGSNRTSPMLNSAFLNEALGTTPDNPATAFSAARDGYFNPYIGAGRNNHAVLDFITQGFTATNTVGKLDSASLAADGPLFHLPAGDVRLAVGAQVRTESIKSSGLTFTSGVTPGPIVPHAGDRTVRSLYAEMRAPLFGDDFRRPGLERLDLSAAVRAERYAGGQTSTVPKLGVVWSPVKALNVKATYGKSFRMPSLVELSDPEYATPVNLTVNGANVLTLLVTGGNPNLQPEKADSWTTGVEFAPASHPQLRLSATYFDTNFKGRIAQPGQSYMSTVLTAADLAPFRQFVTPSSSAADLALVQSFLKYAPSSTSALYPATAYQAVADGRYVNAGGFEVRGLDLTGAYGFEIAGDPIQLNANISWLISYARKLTPLAKPTELAGIAENPADLRARVSAAWTHGPFTTNLALNHTGDLRTKTGLRMAPLTTADLQIQYAPKAVDGVFKGVSVALTVQNLFDKDPPFYDSPQGLGLDSANYDAVGRIVALQLTKAW